MPDAVFHPLEKAFRATCYRVDTPVGAFALRIGQKDPGFAAWLERVQVERWAILTACNPGGESLSAEDNALRQAALREEIHLAGYRFHPACNLPDAADWPAEPAFLLLDAGESAVHQLAALFGQLAFVTGQRQGVVRLVWLADAVLPARSDHEA